MRGECWLFPRGPAGKPAPYWCGYFPLAAGVPKGDQLNAQPVKIGSCYLHIPGAATVAFNEGLHVSPERSHGAVKRQTVGLEPTTTDFGDRRSTS